MTLTFDRFTFLLCSSEEQLGNLSVIALSTLLSTPVRSGLVDLLFKLTLDLIDDLDLDKRSHFRWKYGCISVRFSRYYSIRQYK